MKFIDEYPLPNRKCVFYYSRFSPSLPAAVDVSSTLSVCYRFALGLPSLFSQGMLPDLY